MTATEYLLACMAEEAGEIAHACLKALRFGLNDRYRPGGRTPLRDILAEEADLRAVSDMMRSRHLLPRGVDHKAVNRKLKRMHKFMAYARKKGTLHDGLR